MNPPKLARWLVERVLPRDVRGDTIRGDLLEEFRERDGLNASLWYWRHALSVAVRYARFHREETPSMGLDTTWQDVRYALRSYRKAPTFALTVIATLGLGIGASTAIFSMVYGIVLRPLPYPKPDRIVFVGETNRSGAMMSVSWLNFLDWRARNHSFEVLAASRPDTFVLTGDRPAERVQGRHVTADFFRVLGVRPTLGRDLAAADDRAGATPVVILAHDFWRRTLDASPTVVGTTLMLDERPYMVVGVLPPGFQYLQPYDVFVPMGPIQNLKYIQERAEHAGYYAIGRLRDGVVIDAASRDLEAIAADLRRDYPASNADIGIRLQPLLSRIVSDVQTTLYALLGAVGFLLLMSCANVANLSIARGAARRHEFAVRSAIGGGRWRIVRQLLVESTITCAAGGALGIVVAVGLLRVLVATAPPTTPRLDDVTINHAVLMFALVATGLSSVVFGLVPAFQMSRVDARELVLRRRSAGSASDSHRLRRILIGFEVALALVLLTGAGLMARTLDSLTNVDAGFRSDHLLTLRTSFHGPRWVHARRIATLNDALARIAALPSVVSTAAVSALPIDGSDWNSPFFVGDQPLPPRQNMPSSAFTIVTGGYFDTIGTRLLAGRSFTDADLETSPKVAIVNESLARRMWPDHNPIGKRLRQGFPEWDTPWREVIGVVADVKFEGVAAETPQQVYLPAAQERTSDFAIIVRTAGPPEALQAPIETAIHDMNRDVPLFRVRTMAGILETSVGRERMSVLVLSVFAFAAVVLASIGVYGLVAHSVTERTHEIGVRMALGAAQADVVTLIVGQGLTMAAAGIAVGVAGALALAQSIKTLLFGVAPTDPATLVVASGVLLTVVMTACVVPAWHAARVDPTEALRAE